MRIINRVVLITFLTVLTTGFSGCLLAATGVGAEAGYLATQEDRTTSETIKDQLIVSSIKTKLMADSRAPGLDINVDSFKGVVTLRGALRSPSEVEAALELARDTDGVKDVVSKLVVVN